MLRLSHKLAPVFWLALLSSLLLHGLLLFGTPANLLTFVPKSKEPLVPLGQLRAQLRAPPKAKADIPKLAKIPRIKTPTTQALKTSKTPTSKAPRTKPKPKTPAKTTELASALSAATPVLSVAGTPENAAMSTNAAPESLGEDGAEGGGSQPKNETNAASVIAEPLSGARFPDQGMIRYRVDKGDSNFEIGQARHTWTIADGRYRLFSTVETSGLVWLFKAYRLEMESLGTITAAGFQPEFFEIKRNGEKGKEHALFNWQTMTLRVGERAEVALDDGAQDLLSFNYQLGFIAHLEAGTSLRITNGRKYTQYQLEVLGEEELELPAGVFRTLHLLAPGENRTELWLAYEYLMLPVKIRFVDKKGGILVQVATEIRLTGD